MKSEPDRLDLLIVLLPLALVVVLGVQTYHFFQSREGRAAGAELALKVEELAATKVEIGATKPAAAPANAPAPNEAVEPAAVNAEAERATDAAAAPADSQAPAPVQADAAGGPGAPAPPIPDPQAAAPPAPQPRPESYLPAPPAAGNAGGASGAATAPGARGGRAPAGAGGTVVGTAAAPGGAAPPSTPGDEPPKRDSNTRGAIAPDREPPPRSEPQQPARVTATPQAAEVGVGQLIPVEIRIESGTNVASVPFHLKFDPKILKLNGSPRSERGPFLTQDGSDPQFLVATGPAGDEVIIGLSLLGAAAGASGDGALCTIYFLSVAPGTSPLQFTHASVRGPDARMLPATFVPSAIKVNG